MNRYYVNVETNRYLILDTNDGKTYGFSLNYECGPEIKNMGVFSSSKENLEEYLLVTYDQLVAITRSESILYEAKEAAKQEAKEAARKSTPEYRLKLALTCLLAYVRDYSDLAETSSLNILNDAFYGYFDDLSIGLDEVQDICDGIEVVL